VAKTYAGHVMAAIKGISKTALWNTWKMIRRDLRDSSVRDVIDYLDYDVDPEKWIRRLLLQITSGQYEPLAPVRFTLGKSNGFSRTLTMPSIPDLVLYRTVVDAVYLRSLRKEHSHVYFKRERLTRAQQAAQQQAVQAVAWVSAYKLNSQRSFFNWLRFAQYRKHLLLDVVHPWFVVTDITNFFDSVLHSHVAEVLRGLPVSPRMLGLLFFLLERLSVRHDYASSHAISLPVDEFDCSRTLAHLCLFPHDDAMVGLVGEDNYVRWMDDQNFGVASAAEGLRVLSEVGRSLARLHLAPNAKKSKILTLREARRHFHLDLNDKLDRIEASSKRARARTEYKAVSAEIRRTWFAARQFEGVGEFDKILARLYRLAGGSRLRFLRRRALRDVLANPGVVERVCDYMRCTGTVGEYLVWTELVMQHPEQIYPDINVALMEGLLRIEAATPEAARIRRIAASFLSGKTGVPGAVGCKAIAPLLLLRFGDRRSLPLVKRCFDDGRTVVGARLLRAGAIVYSSYGAREFRVVRAVASRLLANHLADVVRLIERIREYDEIPVRYKSRLELRFDSVAKIRYVDMRSLLTVRLLRLSRSRKVADWVADWKARVLAERISQYDRRLLDRLLR
jgi:hypothetical protein